MTEFHRLLLDPERRGGEKILVSLHAWPNDPTPAVVLYQRDDGEGYALADDGREGTYSVEDEVRP